MNSVTLDLDLWPRQMEAFETPARELLFGGATEGGKSHFARVALIAWCLAIPNLQCVLIRKKFDDILKNHVEGRTGFKNLLAPLMVAGKVTITQSEIRFSNGSLISFQHCQDERQFDSAQGVEKHVLVIDEATQISERLIRFFRTWVRMPKEMKEALPDEWKGKFPRIIYTANPIGPSVTYFKRNFVDALPDQIIKDVAGFPRQYLLSRYTDNPSVDHADHTGRLEGLGDAALARALDLGDWNSITGNFLVEWDEERHVVQDFIPPHWWFRFRGFDWGTAEPFCVYWCAVSDGEPFKDEQGKERWFPRGAFVIYNEWYGCDAEDPAKGNRMRNEDIALGIIARSEYAARNVVTLTDSLPFQDRGGETIAMVFQKHGCTLTLGDTSRVAGWSQVRSRLIGKQIDSNDPTKVPMIYFCACCKYARDYIPALPRHPSESKREDAAEHGEATHSPDCLPAETLITTSKGQKPINQISVDEKVLTRDGYKPVQTVFSVGERQTYKIIFSDGRELIGTENHKIWTQEGFKTIANLRCGDIVHTCPIQTNLEDPQESFGGNISVPLRKDFISIIKTAIRKTIRLKIWSAYLLKNTPNYIRNFYQEKLKLVFDVVKNIKHLLKTIGESFAVATARIGIVGIPELILDHENVRRVKRYGLLTNIVKRDIVARSAQAQENTSENLEKQNVITAKNNTLQESITGFSAPLLVKAVITDNVRKVYNLTVSDCHEYYANGVLVANSIRLICMAHTIVKDCIQPIDSRIAKEIKANRPTIKKITKGAGHAYFN